MNTKSLAKQYDKLTARERFSLLMAAAARGDEQERNRLLQCAPQHCYSLPDHWGIMEAFCWLSDFHFTSLLDLAACYFEAFGYAGQKRSKDNEAAWDHVLLLGYLFQTYWTGWHKFCAELDVDPEWLWQERPGFQTIKRADRISGTAPDDPRPGAAFVEEGVARLLIRRELGDPEAFVDDDAVKKVRVLNTDDIAAGLRMVLERHMAKWG
jgi:hypothetical protein